MGRVIYVVSEDLLGRHVAEKIIKNCRPDFKPYPIGACRGKSSVLKKLPDYNKSADKMIFFVVVDLDNERCVVDFIKQYVRRMPLNKGLLFRIAVREIESWLLADRTGFCKRFKIPKQKLPKNPDSLEDPKRFLVNIIRQYCKDRNYRENIVPQKTTGALVGPAYNPSLIQFIENDWNIERAGQSSSSLKRAVKALKNLYS